MIGKKVEKNSPVFIIHQTGTSGQCRPCFRVCGKTKVGRAARDDALKAAFIAGFMTQLRIMPRGEAPGKTQFLVKSAGKENPLRQIIDRFEGRCVRNLRD